MFIGDSVAKIDGGVATTLVRRVTKKIAWLEEG